MLNSRLTGQVVLDEAHVPPVDINLEHVSGDLLKGLGLVPLLGAAAEVEDLVGHGWASLTYLLYVGVVMCIACSGGTCASCSLWLARHHALPSSVSDMIFI